MQQIYPQMQYSSNKKKINMVILLLYIIIIILLKNYSFNIGLCAKCISQYTDIQYSPYGVYCEIPLLGSVQCSIALSGRGILRISSPPITPYDKTEIFLNIHKKKN